MTSESSLPYVILFTVDAESSAVRRRILVQLIKTGGQEEEMEEEEEGMKRGGERGKVESGKGIALLVETGSTLGKSCHYRASESRWKVCLFPSRELTET